MKKKILFTLLALLVFIGAIIGIKALQIMDLIASGKKYAVPPDSVLVTEAISKSWSPAYKTIGTIEAVRGLTVSNEVPGKIVNIAFDSGATVKAGDILVELDKTTEEAQLRAARSAEELARMNLERSRGLRKTSVVAQSDLDAAEAEAKNATARVEELLSTLDKRTIRAPFSGRLGIRQIHEGQYLKAGDPMISLQAMDPVYVNFSLPQQRLADVSVGMRVRVTTDALPGSVFEGRLTAIDSVVDAVTRNISLQATLENKDGRLRPGMFVAVAAVSPQEVTQVVIPATAVLFAAYGNSVFVVNEGDSKELVAEQKFVRLGEREGDFVAIEEGLTPGERVVSSGGFKLRNGSKVLISDSQALPFSSNPTPPEK